MTREDRAERAFLETPRASGCVVKYANPSAVLHARAKMFLGLSAVVAALAAAWEFDAPALELAQPLPMSHARHLAKDMKCRACHQGGEGQAQASFPTLADCMDCHKKKQGEDPNEPSVRAYAQNQQEIAWIRYNVLPGHVYFSHAAHVTLANMECESCHRDMRTVDHPVGQADIDLDMDECVACHRQKQANLDCLTCHK